MVRVIVDVMPKSEIADPQGQAIASALPGLGFPNVVSVRQGKRFELELDTSDESAQEEVAKIAAILLANPVIESHSVRIDSSAKAE